MGWDHLGPRSVGERGVAVLLGTERKINARGPRGVLEVCRFRLTCVGLGRSRDTTECHTLALFFF